MIKPHIWMRTDGEGWRSDIAFETDSSWQTWMNNYRAFILHYAKIAKLTKAEQFCIGTELHQVVKQKTDFWKELIQSVRAVYSGSLTYAANWYEEVEDVKFWDDLDYIGIQAYYPLTKQKNPNTQELMQGWKKYMSQIEKIQKRNKKPVLFTEIGYKSTPDAAIEPWLWADNLGLTTLVSHETQANCYEAFFKTFWKKSWFAGVHFWEWKPGRSRGPGQSDINFTPCHKPAENIMAKWFGKE